MSRTYRKLPYNRAGFRLPRTTAEIRQLVGIREEIAEAQLGCNNRVKARVKGLPTVYNDITATSCYQMDYNR